MNDPTQNSDQHVAAISKERLLTLVALVGLGIAVAYFYFKSDSAASDLQQQNVDLKKGLENTKAMLAELKQAELRRLEEQSVNATAVEERLADLDRAEGQVRELKDELKRWQTTEADLQTGDLGRRVASSEEVLKQYQALQGKTQPDPLLPDKFQARLDLLRKPLLEAAASPIKAYRPGPAFEHTLLQIQQDITEALVDIRTRNAQLAAVIAQAPSEPTADSQSLSEALKRLDNAWAIAQAEKITAQVQKVRDEFDEKLAAEKAGTERLRSELVLEQERRKREIEEIKERDQSQQLADYAKQLKETQQQKAAKDALERQYQHDLPEIKSLLKPFVTDGRTQPGRHTFEMTVDVGPVSFSKLQGVGALTRTVDAQRKFWSMTTANKTNDRDLGAFPPYVGSAQDWFRKQPTVGRAQELLIKYGPLMVEKGMLAP